MNAAHGAGAAEGDERVAGAGQGAERRDAAEPPARDPGTRPLRVHAAFAGCKVSQADSEAVLAGLARRGCRTVADPAQADVQVVLTCGVTAEAERSSRQLARRLAAHGRPVVVAGCAAALRPEQFGDPGLRLAASEPGRAAAADEVAACVLETAGIRGVVWAVETAGSTGRETGADAEGPDAAEAAPVTAFAGAASRARTRFTLKAQDGCAGSCTYCAVRLVRGRPWSLAADEAVERARAALAAGCGEIVLSGIDVGAYRDPAGGADLAGLVRRLAGLPELRRLRLSSIEPAHLTAELLDALDDPLVARHLHVPLQSADDGVLAAMGRPYTWDGYRTTIERARRRLPGLALSTDLIVGFPAEDEAAFGRSLAAVASAGLFSRVHVFSYSRRAGTAAAALQPLPGDTVKRRARLAREAAAATQRAAAASCLGAVAAVLVEEEREGLLRGYSSTYVRYYLTGEAARGRLVEAVGEGLYRDGVKGRIVDGVKGHMA